MINCRRILELYFEGVSQRTISSSTDTQATPFPMSFVARGNRQGLHSLRHTLASTLLV